MEPGNDWHYAYDRLSRLSYASSDWDSATSACMRDDFNYNFDKAGNLLSDGSKVYAYDAANRLVSVSDWVSTTAYTYNGDGDRVAQTVDGVTTTYVIEIATPLTMVLAETTGTDTIYYLHGLDLIAQSDGASAEYFAYDGLGSVRQVVDNLGEVRLAQGFDPYGNPYISAGNGSTSWGFTGEQTDENGLLFLRARYYHPSQGRFLQRDSWRGNDNQPLSINPWLYVFDNPTNRTDPSGYIAEGPEAKVADDVLQELQDDFNIFILKDYGLRPEGWQGYGLCNNFWSPGAWELEQLKWIRDIVIEISNKFDGQSKFKSAMGPGQVRITRNTSINIRSWAPPGVLASVFGDIVLSDYQVTNELNIKHTIAHELGHVWDSRTGWRLSEGMKQTLETQVCRQVAIGYGLPTIECHFDVTVGKERPAGNPQNPYPNDDAALVLPRDIQGPWEDWADSFAIYIYSDYYNSIPGYIYTLGPMRRQYIVEQINAIP